MNKTTHAAKAKQTPPSPASQSTILILTYGVQLVALVRLVTFQGTVWAALVQTSGHVWPCGVGAAQVQLSFEPFAHAVAHVGVGFGVGHGLASTTHGVVAQAAQAMAKRRVSVFMG